MKFVFLLCAASALFAQNYGNDSSYQRMVDEKGVRLTKEQEMLSRADITNWAMKVKGMNPAYQQSIRLPHPKKKDLVTYSIDCSGYTLAAYTSANVMVFEKQAKIISGTTGVKIMYDTLKGYKKIYRRTRPKTGDIVFFDNTWDANGNGAYDDPLTHTGIVLDVDSMGVIRYLHSYAKGVVISHANLYYKDKYMMEGREFNTFLRRKLSGDSSSVKYLSGELIRAFGTVFDIPADGEEF
ncbi:MAG: NlpC/P60 family protein [Spirochaetota bacterium]